MSTAAKVLIGIAVAIVAIAAVLFTFHNILFPNWTPSWEQSSSKTTISSNQNSLNISGNWSLNLKSDAVATQPTGSVHSMGVGNVGFVMPSGSQKVTMTMPFVVDGTGEVGQSSETLHMQGTVNITGQVQNNKLHLVYTYLYANCVTTLSTPIGGTVSNDCPVYPEQHEADIEIYDGKTAAVHYDETGKSTWLETWTLSKA